LQAQGKAYRWERPSHCPGCNGVRLWGHGYVLRYFQGFLDGLWLKRWRCCDCTQVHTLRPFGWQSRLLHPLALMREAMLHKIRHGRFSHSLASRQVQQYWWQNLKRWAYSQSLSLSMHMLEDHVAGDFPLGVGKIFTSRSLAEKEDTLKNLVTPGKKAVTMQQIRSRELPEILRQVSES